MSPEGTAFVRIAHVLRRRVPGGLEAIRRVAAACAAFGAPVEAMREGRPELLAELAANEERGQERGAADPGAARPPPQ